MKKTAKILIGVLSVGALIGTGYATWHISGGFTSYTTDEIVPGIETIVDDKFGTLEVTAIDDKIRFDSNYNKETGEDLDVSYRVKAVANVVDGKLSDRDPYDLSFYDTISSEYLPNLKVTTIAMKDGKELEETDSFFKYVNLPVFDTVSYKEWLSAEAKENDGYEVNLNFSWGEATEHKNPDEYWRGLDPVTQKNNFEDLTSALKGVTFKFVFEVGGDDSIVVDNKTGAISIPSVDGSIFTIDGMSNGTVIEGTHKVTLEVTDENKILKDSKVYVTFTNEDGVPNYDEINFRLSDSKTIYKTYVGEYAFTANFTYSFSYELADDISTTNIKTFYFKDVAAINGWGSTGYIYAWNSASNEKNAEWPGVALTQMSWNLFDDNANIYMGEIDVSKYDKFVFNTRDIDNNPMGQTRDISVSEVKENNFVMLTTLNEGKYDVVFSNYEKEMETKKATINLEYDEECGKVTYEEKQYYNNDEVILSIDPADGYLIEQVKLGEITIEPVDGVYKVIVKSNENNIVVTFTKESLDYSIGQIKKEGENYTIKGVVAAKDNNSLLIHDGTDGVLVYDRNLKNDIGEYLSVSGGVNKYNGLLQFSYSNNPKVSVENLTETGPILPEATELNNEILETLTTAPLSTKDVKLYKWRATCGTLGTYKTLNINGNEINIEPTSSSYTLNLHEGMQYDVEAYFLGFNTDNNYVSVMLASEPKLVEVNASSVEINAEKTTIKVGESLKLEYTTNPLITTNVARWSTSNEKIISIDDGYITGVSNGSAVITLELYDASNKLTAKNSLTIFVEGISNTKVYNYAYEKGSGIYTDSDLTIDFSDFTFKYDFSNCTTKLKSDNTYTSLRIYGKGAITLSSNKYKIKQVTLTYSEGEKYELPLTVNKEIYSISSITNSKCTISCLDENGRNDIAFINGNAAQVRISAIEIVYYI